MTQEEKSLLLQDICARLPYRVKVSVDGYTEEQYLTSIDTIREVFNTKYSIEERIFGRHDELHVKPYLRLMSSMTEEECVEFKWLNAQCDDMPTFEYVSINHYKIFDWLNKYHFDYRGLIEKGLALEAPKDMYNIK